MASMTIQIEMFENQPENGINHIMRYITGIPCQPTTEPETLNKRRIQQLA